jgi:hypothetical protein
LESSGQALPETKGKSLEEIESEETPAFTPVEKPAAWWLVMSQLQEPYFVFGEAENSRRIEASLNNPD